MNHEHDEEVPPPRRRWPWILLAGVILFFIVSTLWVLALVQRVKRVRDSTYPPTNAAAAPTNRPAAGPVK